MSKMARFCSAVLGMALLLSLYSVAQAQATDFPKSESQKRPAAFLQFTPVAHEFAKVPAPASTVPPQRSSWRFEMVITTPTTAFPHMRPGGSNALVECIVPSVLRKDPQ